MTEQNRNVWYLAVVLSVFIALPTTLAALPAGLEPVSAAVSAGLEAASGAVPNSEVLWSGREYSSCFAAENACDSDCDEWCDEHPEEVAECGVSTTDCVDPTNLDDIECVCFYTPVG
jgi:hypothetical protein